MNSRTALCCAITGLREMFKQRRLLPSGAKTRMTEQAINSFLEFCAFVEKLPQGTMYRGVRNSSYDLVPSIARKTIDHRPVQEIEKILLMRFMNEAFPFLAHKPTNDFELLTIAQHHGLPTRLLDWTRSPFAALFFAAERHLVHDPCAVYVLPDGQAKLIDQILGNPSIDDVKEVLFYPPVHIATRVAAQSAFFSIHPPPFTAWQPAELIKVVIPGKAKEGMLNSLGRAGIKSATLFPDLDGLCRTLRHEYGFWE